MASWVLTNWWSVMWKKDLIMNFVMMSQHHVVSNHQQLVCLLNSLFRLTAPSNHHLCITGPLWEECQHWLVVSLQKGQLCKNFPVSSHQHLIQGFSQEGPRASNDESVSLSCYHLISTLFFSFFFRLATQSSITLTTSPGYEKVLNRPTTAAFPSRRTIRSLPGSLLKLTLTLRGHKCQVRPGDWACVAEQLFLE